MGFVPKWSRGNHKKTAPSHAAQGVRQMPSLFHGAKDAQFSAPNLFADGGEVSEEVLKAEGIKASENEGSLLDRLKAGNIDDPNSEAYRRYGAGRGAEARMSAREDARDAEMNRLMNERANRPAVTDDRNEMDKASDAAKPSAASTGSVSAPKFGEAFAAARKAGASEFEWNGKKYNTKMKSDAAAAPSAKPSASVKYATAENESAAESARLAEAARRAAERKEVPRAGMVKPRPLMNWSTPADRARWDEKFKATHNEDGTPK